VWSPDPEARVLPSGLKASDRTKLACPGSRTGPLALGVLDADHFKEVNRLYDLSGGDAALRGIALALSAALRLSDRAGRIGGEEFLVVAPQTDAAGAAVLAERLRASVAGEPIRYNGSSIAVTISLGFAVADTGIICDYPQLRHAADAALAEAKAAGRNRPVIRPM
jgi:diguanylate cyclase (GGDEF)-like protein